ncbi:hypothetical protein B6N60_01018 [Richelia sinica FACHB-800]|uniref:Uncharacterized protein n=1 Tax=Richelia sinica FACHB-800 TaxID=1357546 RepID=A0A975Y3P0_9NOST|nr:hypothetical protein [Richelia sinica]MBD2664913.1 hypothetical protein [Richelia sinica FACHB-800]QXE22335.1 hypothetical protein B6N60_01018 [Richelia sinica FACHB-800]
MSNLKISDLSPVGCQFFQDSESFLLNLQEDELYMTHGGILITATISVIKVPVSEDIFAPSISFIM